MNASSFFFSFLFPLWHFLLLNLAKSYFVVGKLPCLVFRQMLVEWDRYEEKHDDEIDCPANNTHGLWSETITFNKECNCHFQVIKYASCLSVCTCNGVSHSDYCFPAPSSKLCQI